MIETSKLKKYLMWYKVRVNVNIRLLKYMQI